MLQLIQPTRIFVVEFSFLAHFSIVSGIKYKENHFGSFVGLPTLCNVDKSLNLTLVAYYCKLDFANVCEYKPCSLESSQLQSHKF